MGQAGARRRRIPAAQPARGVLTLPIDRPGNLQGQRPAGWKPASGRQNRLEAGWRATAPGSPSPSSPARAPPVGNRRLPGKTGSKPVGWDGIGIAEPQLGLAGPNRR